MPIISNAPKDHHSLMQLYLDGPKDKFFYVFSSKDNNYFKFNSKFLEIKLSFLNKKVMSKLKIHRKKHSSKF